MVHFKNGQVLFLNPILTEVISLKKLPSLQTGGAE
jgi:hypothetical protein